MSYSAFIAGCIVQCTLILFAIVVCKKSADKQQSGNNSNMPTSTRSNIVNNNINYRLLLISIISFTIGLQFKNVYDLMFATSGLGDVSIDGAWAPDDMHEDLNSYRGEPIINTDNNKRFAVTASLQEDNNENNNEYTDNRRQRRRRRQRERDQNEKEGDTIENNLHEPKKRKKRVKEPRRYESSNYTDDFQILPWSLPLPRPIRYLSSEEFMKIYIATKRKHNISLPWEEKNTTYANSKVSLPLPIISLNFPKSATLTMKTFFLCGGVTAIHTSTQDGRIGICMMENQLNDKPPMTGCNMHKERQRKAIEELTDDAEMSNFKFSIVPIDFISDIGLQGPPCYYSSLHDGGLENIVKHYPKGTISLITRNATSWARSMSKWGSILLRWKRYCGFDGSVYNTTDNMKYWNNMYERLPKKEKEEYWVNFYHAHTQKIREFAMTHLSMSYFEVELENPNMAKILQHYTKISPDCVMDCHPGPKWVRENNATSRCHPVGKNPALMREIVEDGENGDINDANHDGEEDDDNIDDDDDDSVEAAEE